MNTFQDYLDTIKTPINREAEKFLYPASSTNSREVAET